MKNIKYLALLFSLTLLISCGEDDVDSITNDGIFSPTSEISIGFTDSNDGVDVDEDGGQVSFTIGLSVNPLSVSTEVTLGVISSDGEVEATIPQNVTIPAGENSVTIDITLSNDLLIENNEVYTISIIDADFGGSSEYYLTSGNIERSFNIVQPPLTVITIVEDVDFNFTWSGTSGLDIRIRDAGLTDVDTGYSVTPGETVTMGSAEPDGVYTISVRPWTVADPTSDYTIEFVSTGGSLPLTGTLTLGTGFWSEEFNILEITKSTNGTEVTYSFVQL